MLAMQQIMMAASLHCSLKAIEAYAGQEAV